MIGLDVVLKLIKANCQAPNTGKGSQILDAPNLM
jgi:hypothetical protein